MFYQSLKFCKQSTADTWVGLIPAKPPCCATVLSDVDINIIIAMEILYKPHLNSY